MVLLGGNQDYPTAHTALQLRDGLLVLYVENQGVFQWGVLAEELGLDDPRIVTREDEENAPLVWNERLSEFCWQMALHQHFMGAVIRRQVGAELSPADDLVARVAAIYPRLPLPGWGWGNDDPETIVFFGDHETLLELDVWAPRLSISAASDDALARVRLALAPLEPSWLD